LSLGFEAQRRSPQQQQRQQTALSEKQALDGPGVDDPSGLQQTIADLEAWAATGDPVGLKRVQEARTAGDAAIAKLSLSEGDKRALRFQLAEAAWKLRIAQGQDLPKSPLVQALLEASKEAEALLPSFDRVPELGAEKDDNDRRSTLQELFAGPLQPLTWLNVPQETRPSVDHRDLLKKLPQIKRRAPTKKHPLSRLLAGLQNS
jgi:hypothetical protein